MLNVGSQLIRLRSKRISKLNDVELSERFLETTFTAERASAIEATLGIPHDRKRLTQCRGACTDVNRRLAQPRRCPQSADENDGRDRNAGGDGCQPVILAYYRGVHLTTGGSRPTLRPLTRRRRGHRIEASETMQEHEREVTGAALFNCARQQITRTLEITSLIGGDSLVQALLGFPLTLGKRAPGALDVRARAAVATLEERDARPHIDRLLVVTTEVVVETGQEQLFDTCNAIGLAQRASVGRFSAEWLHADVIIGQELTLVNRFRPARRAASPLQPRV